MARGGSTVTTLRSLAATAASTSLLLGALAIAGCRTTPEPAAQGGSSAPPPAQAPTATPAPELAIVYFDFDSAVLREDARATLKKNAEELRATPNTVITLEGHCDERGSEEYNLALGERRGESVRSYLVDLGIPASRLRVVSFGEAKPAVMGHDESAWKWNRRVEAH
jgi:peptidoglycan-associated lipoprotein